MPQIIVKAGRGSEDGAVMLRERITASDFASGHFAQQLLERLGWAVEDAHVAEQDVPSRTGRDVPSRSHPPASVVTTAS
ncbi:MAG: hypothetical protein ACYC91_03960 [Solirubrobacteraceae bacterium]